MSGRRVVFAPDSLKGSMRAADAASALAAGWREVEPTADVVLRPMADGGEGTIDAFAAAVPGSRRMPVMVRGPHGRDIAAQWLLLPDDAGVVELASTSGIELLGQDGLAPWDADTFGFGQAIAAALDHGVSRLVLGIGSSASTDGGVGMLTALGARFVDDGGVTAAPGLRGLGGIAAVDMSGLRPPPSGGAVVLSDVTNPLCGPRGAAAVFGTQKGLDGASIAIADAALARLAPLLPASPDVPGTGAAGGTGFGLLAWGARLAAGAEEIAGLIGLREAVAAASVVVTGEGAYDGQSAAGKAPAHVAAMCAAAGVPVALVAGRIETDDVGFAASVSLTELAGSGEAARADPGRWLRAAGAALARAL